MEPLVSALELNSLDTHVGYEGIYTSIVLISVEICAVSDRFLQNKNVLFDFVSCLVKRAQNNRPEKKLCSLVAYLTDQFVEMWSGFMAQSRARQLSESLSGCWNKVSTYVGKIAHCNA